MWEAIKRLQQGESLNIQDVKINLFWEFGQFTSHDGETIESYYTRFYKMMNEMIRNNLTVATMQVNIQFLQQLQPEWLRFVTIVKQQHKLDGVSYHKLFDILKQYQKEVNELRAERMAKNANIIKLVANAQTLQDPFLPNIQNLTNHFTNQKLHFQPDSCNYMIQSDPEQAQKDKDMQKNLALIAKYFKKLFNPTYNNSDLPQNTRNKKCGYYSKTEKRCFNFQEEQSDWLADTMKRLMNKMEMGDSNVTPDSQLDSDEIKKIQKQLRKQMKPDSDLSMDSSVCSRFGEMERISVIEAVIR
ncbi:hypothetical protein Tco_0720132 [Tanacetum coccineum]